MSELTIFAVIHKAVDTAYWVSAPDMPGCFACGDTINEAIESFHEALELHVEGMREDNVPLPNPRGREEILLSLDEEPVEVVAVKLAV